MDQIELLLGPGGELRGRPPGSDGVGVPVSARPAFPLSDGEGPIVVRDLAGRTIALIAEAAQLSEPVLEACRREHQVKRVLRVRSARAEGDWIHWEVETGEGACSFESEDKRTSFIGLKGGIWVVRARDGVYYRFPPLVGMDEGSYWEAEHYLQSLIKDTGDPLARG